MLQTLYNLGPAPEPNLTIWYSPRLPEAFRRFSAKVAIDTSSIQFESDEIMRRTWGDDGAIACCVSPMLVGKQMQFFGARANLAKCLLYAINGGRDGDHRGAGGSEARGGVITNVGQFLERLGGGNEAVLAIPGFGQASLTAAKKKLRSLGYEIPAAAA